MHKAWRITLNGIEMVRYIGIQGSPPAAVDNAVFDFSHKQFFGHGWISIYRSHRMVDLLLYTIRPVGSNMVPVELIWALRWPQDGSR